MFGGASRDRTGDLKLAKLALSQLSYGPDPDGSLQRRKYIFPTQHEDVVGLGRFELPTSRLSSARSNQLSYRPETGLLALGSDDEGMRRRRHVGYLLLSKIDQERLKAAPDHP